MGSSSKSDKDIAGVKEGKQRRDYLKYIKRLGFFFFLPQYPVEGKKLKQSAAWPVSIWQRKTTPICSGQPCQNSLVSGDKKHQFFTASGSVWLEWALVGAVKWALVFGLMPMYFPQHWSSLLGLLDVCSTHSSCSSLHCPCDRYR